MSTPDPEASIPEWTFGDRLRKAREQAGVRIIDIADELARNRNTISGWESGRHRPSEAVIRRWALRFQVPYQWLKYGEAPDTERLTGRYALIPRWSEAA